MIVTLHAVRGALVALALVAAAGPAASAAPPTTGAPTARVRRVELDRLKWAPDGGALAIEARWQGPDAPVSPDTLIIDLNMGAATPLSPRPILFALHDATRRLAVLDRHGVWTGPLDRPEALAPLVRIDPTSSEAERLGWNAAGDTLYVALRTLDGSSVEIAGFALGSGSRTALGRHSRSEAENAWRTLEAQEALPVVPNPFPGLYQSVGDNLFFIERTEMDTPGTRARWYFDLHHRNRFDGSERILARRMAPEALLVSPDSMWLAIPGREYRADYGGSEHRTLWLASPDGQEFFSVRPAGVREAEDVVARALAWFEGRLWYLTDSGLFVVSPVEGRSRALRLGPPPPEWARTLPEPARLITCRLPESHADSSTALGIRDRLRRDGWPAWISGGPGGPFRVAVGAAGDEETLRSVLGSLRGGAELLRDFPPEWIGAVAEGATLPYAVRRDPGGAREAWITALGPPGERAGELWLTEAHGARRIRLLRARWLAPTAPATAPAPLR